MIKDKVLGCIIGGAVGDALGYPIEFRSHREIVSQFGKSGVVEYVYDKGLISDDTQMVLFTIDGLLKNGDNKVQDVYQSYLDWYVTQNYPFSGRYNSNRWSESSKLLNISDLYDLRAPGNTCLSALNSGKMGTVENPINNSKGCGGVMRVAPIGLYFKPENHDIGYVAKMGGDISAITHGHQLGYLSSAVYFCNTAACFYNIICN